MKIIFVNYTMQMGGIATSLINLIQNLSKSVDFEIHLLLLNSSEKDIEKFPPSTKILKTPFLLRINNYSRNQINKKTRFYEVFLYYFLRINAKIFGKERICKIVSLLSKVDGDYDIAISFANDIFIKSNSTCGPNHAVLFSINSNKKIGWIHNDPNRLGLNNKLANKIYQRFDRIINVSYEIKKMFDDIFPRYKQKSYVVYNLYNSETLSKAVNHPNPYSSNVFNIVTVARLQNEQKRIDRIIEICSYIKMAGNYDFKWYLIGDGPDSDLLKQQAKLKNIEDVLVFCGKKENPYPFIYYANIFVQTSDYEAYSMVLIESITLKTPIICTNYPSAKEIIIDGENGFLVDLDTISIANKIINLMEDATLLKSLRSSMLLNNNDSNLYAIQQFYASISF